MNNFIKLINNIIKNFAKPSNYPPLGRWYLKHNTEECNKYMINIYADPGYYKNKAIYYKRK